MSPDRYGDSDGTPGCPHGCNKQRWLTSRDADVMIPCPIHRPPKENTGIKPTHYSERAAEAIAAIEDREGS